MGKLKRIEELEADVSYWRKRSEVRDDVKHYLDTLSEMPDDAVLLYTLTGMRVQHEIGKTSKVLLGKMNDGR